MDKRCWPQHAEQIDPARAGHVRLPLRCPQNTHAAIAGCRSPFGLDGATVNCFRGDRSGVVAFGVAVDTSSVSPAEIAALVANLDPEVRDAIGDVDRTLIALSLQQSPWDRLRSASRTAQTLLRIRDAAASEGH